MLYLRLVVCVWLLLCLSSVVAFWVCDDCLGVVLCRHNFKKDDLAAFEAAVADGYKHNVNEATLAAAQSLWRKCVAERRLAGLITMCDNIGLVPTHLNDGDLMRLKRALDKARTAGCSQDLIDRGEALWRRLDSSVRAILVPEPRLLMLTCVRTVAAVSGRCCCAV